VSFYHLQNALKDSVKKFSQALEITSVNKSDLHTLVKSAVSLSKFEHLKLILFGDMSVIYSPLQHPEHTESLVSAVRLRGLDVFDIKDIQQDLAASDSIEILQLLQDFHYPVMSPDFLLRYVSLKSLNILSFLLQEGYISVADITSASPDPETLNFELLVLLNTRDKVTIPKKESYYDYEDSRKHIFEEGILDRNNYEGLIKAVLLGDLQGVMEITKHTTLDEDEKNTCLDFALDEGYTDILRFLITQNFKPGNIEQFVKRLYSKNPSVQLALLHVMIGTLRDQILEEVKNSASFSKALFYLRPPSIQYLFKENIIEVTTENMYFILNETKPDQVKNKLVFLYSLSFPIHNLDLTLIKSSTSRERIKPLVGYFSNLKKGVECPVLPLEVAGMS
jgi:hypothetical protein